MIDCSKCPGGQGCCCGVFQMAKSLIEKHKDKIQIKEYKKIDVGGELICLVPGDFRCVFFNRQKKICEIYEDRPEICKLYGSKEAETIKNGERLACRYFKPNGHPRSQAMMKKIERLQDRMADEIINYGKGNKIRIQKVP